MLLTIKQPAYHSYTKSFHDYTPLTPPSSSRLSPVVASLLSATNRPLPALTTPATELMSAPHRGLPPPAAMTLPQPTQQPPPISQAPLSQPLGQLPAPPQQWQGAEDAMRNWLSAKAEEDKRKQEEEKTRQESLRLEQRRIEQEMLRTSLSGGIPPYMIPMVFAGMGGGNLPNASLEWAQHYMAQAHHLQQQQSQTPQQQLPSQSYATPEQLPRGGDARGQPYPGSEHPAPVVLPSTPAGPLSGQQNAGFTYQISPTSGSQQLTQVPSVASRQPHASHLPRLNTGEIHIQPAGPGVPSGQQPQTQRESSPSIYFHHWQPPTSQAGGSSANQPTTPSEPSSPKKRKATGPQQAAPLPSSLPQYSPPPFSHTASVSHTPSNRRRGHSRQRSDISARGPEPYGRPPSRHRHTESSFSAHNMASPVREQGPAPGRPRGGSNPVSAILEYHDPRASSQSRAAPHDPRSAAGPETRRDERRTPPGDEPRRASGLARDDARD